MGDSLLEKMYEAKKEYEVAYVCFYGKENGKDDVKEFKNYYNNSIESAKAGENTSLIASHLQGLARDHGMFGNYDSLDVNLSFGIVYKKEDVDNNNKTKVLASPIPGIVSVRIDNSSSYLERDLVKTNLGKFSYGEIGFISLDDLVSYLDDEGLNYKGPETYDDVKYDIIAGKKSTATITANLVQKRNKTLIKK